MPITAEAAGFLAGTCPYPAQDLTAALWSSYARITLVSKERAERVTFDLDVEYSSDGESAGLPGIVVAEVKYERGVCESEFVRAMHKHRIRSTGFSKYCMGISLLYPGVKHNSFKAKQRLVARAQGDRNELS